MFAYLKDPTARKYSQLGEETGIGATAHLLRVCGKTIGADFGISISRNGEFQIQGLPAGNFLNGEDMDLIFITHAHLDHIGAVARLIAEHSEAAVIISRKALEALRVLLLDSIKIAKDEIRRACMADVAEEELPKMIFDEGDLYYFLDRAKSGNGVLVVDEDGWYEFDSEWDGWSFGVFDSGHDIGAKSFLIIPPDRKPIYLTGDVASQNQEIVKGVMLPDWQNSPDGFWDLPGLTMITEATNGAKNEISWSEGKTRRVAKSVKALDDQFEKTLQAVKSRGGIVQIATFAKNRGSNMVLKVTRMGFRVAIDGMLRKLIRIELGEDRVNQLVAEGKLIIVDETDPLKAQGQREALAHGAYGFVVIVAPSATLDQGFAVLYAEKILPGEKNALIFPGYMFPDSTAKQIIEIERGRTIKLDRFVRKEGGGSHKEPVLVNVRCDVLHFDYTSHDYQSGLVERVRLARPEKLVVHHCSDEAFEAYVTALRLVIDYPLEIIRGSHLGDIDI